ncbi:MAG: D-alanyl-D-alanine carboxypeptidase/D-alanyl-D-alanine-endopeptidase [Acidobacteria bacterium]|nr:D-alanyl-D-alanine carboxypeptidase/D-alanyl-D-alanine-endopeptidase [Acidobacteriota bacterium]
MMGLRLLALFLCLLGPLGAGELGAGISRLLEASPTARHAFWGIRVVDLGKQDVLFSLNADNPFVPASNTKLFTMALGLTRLGPDYRSTTLVMADQSPDAGGVVHGSLRLIGGGDPNLSARAIPYRMGPNPGDPLQAIEELAAQVAAHGVRRIEGDVVGDDSAYVWAPYPDGWAVDDAIWDYGAPVSALTIHDNAISLILQPGAREGDPARISFFPPVEYYRVDNRVLTENRVPENISVDREPGSKQVRIWGSIPSRARAATELLGIDDPALYGATVFYNALARRGVSIAGKPAVRHLYPNQVADLKTGAVPDAPAGVELARRVSAPLLEDLRITSKVSQNLHAELLLRAVGRARRNIGSREAGLEEMACFLDEAGIGRDAYSIHDGSGLSRLNLVTPEAVVALLGYMYRSPNRESWLGLLPVGGRDGTLSGRFGATPAAGRILAKTGTLSHVSALSGYAEARSGAMLAFSILVNNYTAHASGVQAIIDRICNLMVE